MTDCRICSGPVDVRDRDATTIQGEGFQGFVCGHCVEPVPERRLVLSLGMLGPKESP